MQNQKQAETQAFVSPSFLQAPPITWAFKHFLSKRTYEGGETFTECLKNQALAYHTGACSLWAQRAEEWINPTHYIQKN